MSTRRMIVYASLGSLVSVMIWSLIGGCYTAKEGEPAPAAVSAPAPEKMEETEAVLAGEEIAIEKKEEAAPVPAAAPEQPQPPREVKEETSAPSEAMEETYTVQPGDSLWSIGKKYGVTVQELQQTNSLDNPERLSIGQKLRIPR